MSMEVLQFVKDPVSVLVRSNTNIFIVVLVQLEWWGAWSTLHHRSQFRDKRRRGGLDGQQLTSDNLHLPALNYN